MFLVLVIDSPATMTEKFQSKKSKAIVVARLAPVPGVQLVGAQWEKQRAKKKGALRGTERTLQMVIPPTYRPPTETRNATAGF